MPNRVKTAIEDLAQEVGSDWIGSMPVWLGDLSGVVETGTAGKYYARYGNSQVITVSNAAKVAPIFDLHVLVRRSRIQPGIWQITEVLEDYDVPADGGTLAAHHEQHEETGFDRLNLDRKQIKQLSIRAAGGWIVQVYGATAPTASGPTLIPHTTIDLSSYVVTGGAQYIGIEVDDSGAISVNSSGPNFGSPLIVSAANIPTQDPGKYLLGYVLMYEGQTEITDPDIVVIMPLPIISKTAGFQISEAPADTPDDSDLFGFWDVTDEELKSISWLGLVILLTAIFDLLYQPLGDYLTDAPSDGTTYGRKDGAWEPVTSGSSSSGGGGGALLGLARWSAASGETAFELPDLWEAVHYLAINGLEEDPLVYSLSSDRTQLILDTALSSASIVTARGIISQ